MNLAFPSWTRSWLGMWSGLRREPLGIDDSQPDFKSPSDLDSARPHRLLDLLLTAALLIPGFLGALTAQSTLVQGRVVDALGHPLSGAQVALHPHRNLYQRGWERLNHRTTPPTEAAVLTDERGLFRLRVSQRSLYSLSVVTAGYFPMQMGPTVFLPGTPMPDVVLLPAGRARSQILVHGRPTGGLLVDVMGPARRNQPREWSRSPWGPLRMRLISDNGGWIEYPALPGRDSRLAAWAPGVAVYVRSRNAQTGRVELRLLEGAPLRFQVVDQAGRPVPDVMVIRQGLAQGLSDRHGMVEIFVHERATRDHLRLLAPDGSGFQDHIDLGDPPSVITLTRPGDLTIAVTETGGSRRVANAAVWFGEQNQVCMTDRNGRCSLKVWPISSTFVADAVGYRRRTARLGETRQGMSMTLGLPPMIVAQGWVTDSKENPIDAARVRSRPAYRGLTEDWGRNTYAAQAWTHPDGSFLIEVHSSNSDLAVRADYPRLAPDLQNSHGEPVHLVLSEGGVVTGRVVDPKGRPVAEAWVSLHRTPARSGTILLETYSGIPISERQVLSGPDGTFRIEGVPAEALRVSVFPGGAGWMPVLSPLVLMQEAGRVIDVGDLEVEPAQVVEGRVVDSQSRPIKDARVSVLWDAAVKDLHVFGDEGPARCLSDEEGYFSLYGPSQGSIKLLLERDGYHSRQPEYPIDAPQPLQIVLKRPASVKGQVVDAQGTPVAGASVQVQYRPPDEKDAGFDQSVGNNSDEKGRFEIRNLRAGDHRFVITPEGHGPQVGEPFNLEEGEDREMVVTVHDAPVTVTGRILSPDGELVEKAFASITPNFLLQSTIAPSTPSTQLEVENGTFQTTFPQPGPYILRAHAPDVGARRLELDLKEGEHHFEVELDPTQLVNILVLGQDGEKAQDYMLSVRQGHSTSSFGGGRNPLSYPIFEQGTVLMTAQQDQLADFARIEVGGDPLPQVTLRLAPGIPVEGRVQGLDPDQLRRLSISISHSEYSYFTQASASEAGNVVSRPLFPGDYRVLARVEESAHSVTRSLRVEEEDRIVRLDLDFPPGFPVDFQVLGNGRPLQARYTLIGAGLSSADGQADSSGRIYLDGLREGTYRLTLSGAFGTTSHEVQLPRDANRVFDLKLIDISGEILDPSGEPVDGAAIAHGDKAVPSPTRQAPELPKSGPEGRFTLKGVLADYERIVVDHPDFALQSVALPEPEDGAVKDLQVMLEEAGTAQARLADPPTEEHSRPAVLRFDPMGKLVDPKASWSDSGQELTMTQLGSGETRFRLIMPDMRFLDFTLRPGQVRQLEWSPQSRLQVDVSPALGTATHIKLWDSQGRPYSLDDVAPGLASRISRSISGAWWPLRGGQASVPGLPSGRWRVQVVFLSGQILEREVVVREGQASRIRFD
ncbi:MAG TPA: carboxypeptidase regulatory-like domain-containing protein [Acidobacteriota bacterium]|nr:carboxypeptidase regulatory-like domain-containing protein [Acidobacteriota bacterium]